MTVARLKAGVCIRPFVRNGVQTGQWQVDVAAWLTFSNRRERRLVASRKEAEAKVRELVGEHRARGVVELTGGVQPVIHLQFVIEGWLAEQRRRVAAGKKKAASLDTNLFHLERIAEFLRQLPLTSLTRAHLDGYQAHRLEQGLQPETINSELGTFTQVQRWAVAAGHLKAVVTTDPVPLRRKVPDILTYEEYQAILDQVPSRLRAIIRLLAETGCRWGEAAQLPWEAVDLDRAEAYIAPHGGWTPKTAHSARTLYLSDALVAELRERHAAATATPKASAYVFPGRDGMKPVTTARRAFRSAVERADIRRGGRTPRITIKTLRKCFATWAAENGMRERTFQSLMGHAPGSRVTKKHYEQVRPAHARAELAAVWGQMGTAA